MGIFKKKEVLDELKEDISKIFALEIRDKKKVGSNIFKRVSTRRGGTNMSSMRVPTKKEQKELSGEVSTFNMKQIIPYEEFKTKSEKDQKMLMEFWRGQYQTNTILEGLSISKNVFYKVLDSLGIERNSNKKHVMYDRTAMSESELESYLNDKEHFLDYELFRIITSEQQDVLINEYLNRMKSIPKLVEVWEGAQAGTLYYIKSRMTKRMKGDNDTLAVSAEKSSASSEKPQNELLSDETAKKTEKTHSSPSVKTEQTNVIPLEKQEVVVSEAEIVPAETSNNNLDEMPDNKHTVNITMDTKANEQSFNFSLKGSYSRETILRRLSMLMDEIQEAEEKLTIDISIKG